MSSSSSMCDFDEFYSYPLRNCQEPWCDYYQAMGHPLIYYAEVQPSSRRSRSGVRKDPNFFVKAFRWYTQEHHPHLQGQGKATNPDFSGFANWLDAKYGQYIQEGQREQINQLTVPEPRKPKKLLASMKSHFRRHKTKTEFAGQKRSCNSCEYIMQPKEMSLTGSDCKRSNIKAVCSDTQEKKSIMKSVSMTSSRYDVDYHKSIEIMMTEGDTNEKLEDNCSCTKTEVLTIYDSKPQNLNVVSIGQLPCDLTNVDNICECETPGKVNTYAQYDNNMSVSKSPVPPAPSVPSKNNIDKRVKKRSSNKNLSVSTISKKSSHRQKTPKSSDASCMCSLERVNVPTSQPTKSANSNECRCTPSFKNAVKAVYQKKYTPTFTPLVPPLPAPVVTPTKAGCVCSIRVNEAMQTSDTSIRLDDEVTKCPFFMKIVRADKLITDC